MKNVIFRFIKNSPSSGYFLLSKIFGLNIYQILHILGIKYDECVTDDGGVQLYYNRMLIYEEYNDFSWAKYTFDSVGNKIRDDYNDGCWAKYEYDSNNNRILEEIEDGWWCKTEYNLNNSKIKDTYSDGEVVYYPVY